MEPMKISKATRLSGRPDIPGDKSISHRAAMLASIANGTSRISNFAESADCLSTLSCLRSFGVAIEREGTEVVIHGVGKRGFDKPETVLDCGNSGTTMRLLSGLLAGQKFETALAGDSSLNRRPMGRIAEPLRLMGAQIEMSDGHAPLAIVGFNPLIPIDYRLPVASAQIKSCVLLAGLYGSGKTSVIEPIPTRDHTERMLRSFGVIVDEEYVDQAKKISVSGDSELSATDIRVPSDISSAAFFMVAAGCLPGSSVELPDIGINPTRSGILEILRRFGIEAEVIERSDPGSEPTATLFVSGNSRLRDITGSNRIDGPIIANLIDEIPILAVLGTQLDGGLEIRDARELRVKETDRIAAVAENLRRINADVEEFEDGLRVGRSQLKGSVVDSFGDHRISMAFAIAGLFAEGETEIIGAECAAVSFPGFFDTLDSLVL